MKKICFLALLSYAHTQFSQVTPNSNRFEIKNYIAINDNGKYYPYNAHGFIENAGSGSNGKIFMMPLLELDLKRIRYIDSNGHETDKSSSDVYSITIPITANTSLPNESQKAAIGSSLNSGTAIKFFAPPLVKDNFGGNLINPNAGIYSPQIIAQINQYEQNILHKQQQYIDAYNQHPSQIISLTEYEVIVKVGNETVYSDRFPGTLIAMGNSLDDISIDRPTPYVKNRISEGNFTILIKYKFRDSKNSYINAQIDANTIISQFFSEVQRSTVSQSSSGWSFLGFGSRRKSLKSSFDQQVDQRYTDQRFSNTTIEMFDVDDQMIQLFEDNFFPKTSQQNAIDNHLAAAEKARQEGNSQLQQYHLDYVKALQTNDPNLEANIGAAVAALSKNDYIGFIAHGVRWGDYRTEGNSTFRRVLNSTEMAEMHTRWSQTKTISVQHSVSQKVGITQNVELRASLGLINGIPYPANNMFISNGFTGQWKTIRGIVLGPIIAGSALHMKSITPGTLITKIGSHSVYDAQSLTDAMESYSPNETTTVTVIEQIGFNLFQEKSIPVTLGAYPKLN